MFMNDCSVCAKPSNSDFILPEAHAWGNATNQQHKVLTLSRLTHNHNRARWGGPLTPCSSVNP